MSSSDVDRFLDAIVQDHGLATGIKPLTSDCELVAFAQQHGFSVSLADWGRHVAMDRLQQSDEELDVSLRADPQHWSWAFRQTARLRGLLMDGAQASGVVAAPSSSSAAIAAGNNVPELSDDQQKDQTLELFIQKARQNPELKERIKFARNQDEVLEIAAAEGFPIDSLTILRKWSQHSDFSKPTWFGWFED